MMWYCVVKNIAFLRGPAWAQGTIPYVRLHYYCSEWYFVNRPRIGSISRGRKCTSAKNPWRYPVNRPCYFFFFKYLIFHLPHTYRSPVLSLLHPSAAVFGLYWLVTVLEAVTREPARLYLFRGSPISCACAGRLLHKHDDFCPTRYP